MPEACFAVTAPGLEPLTVQELTPWGGAAPGPSRWGLFDADLSLIYRANLELRTATRILRSLREFAAAHSECSTIRPQNSLEKWIRPQQTFLVDAVFHGQQRREGQNGELRNSHFAALKIKDAIVDRIREETGARPSVSPERPDIVVHALFFKGRCRISLDSSGQSLHERGYRAQGPESNR